MRKRRTRDEGYTLLEMLVVLVVIGLIVAIATPQLFRLLGGAKADAARLQVESLGQSLQFYQLDTGAFPTTEQGLRALWVRPEKIRRWRGPYVRKEKQLVDPWGNAFVYRAPGKVGPYDLVSLGADGREGGEGEDTDLDKDE